MRGGLATGQDGGSGLEGSGDGVRASGNDGDQRYVAIDQNGGENGPEGSDDDVPATENHCASAEED